MVIVLTLNQMPIISKMNNPYTSMFRQITKY
nr:MAG TPA: Sorbin homologous domain [Caudoviricetes sp.]